MNNNKNNLGYVVFQNHTLGYLFSWFDWFGLAILKGKISKGGLNWRMGHYMILPFNYKHIRMATKQDFDDFGVFLSENMR